MRHQFKFICLSAGLLLIASNSWGICHTTNCVSKIKQIVIQSSSIKVRLEEELSEVQKLQCTPKDGVYLELVDSENTDRMYSAILAAQMAGHSPMFRIVDNSDPCEISYIRVYGR